MWTCSYVVLVFFTHSIFFWFQPVTWKPDILNAAFALTWILSFFILFCFDLNIKFILSWKDGKAMSGVKQTKLKWAVCLEAVSQRVRINQLHPAGPQGMAPHNTFNEHGDKEWFLSLHQGTDWWLFAREFPLASRNSCPSAKVRQLRKTFPPTLVPA